MRKTKINLPAALKLSEEFISGSDIVLGAYHQLPKTEGLKKNEAEEHFRLGTKLALQEYPDFEGSKEHLLQAITYRPDYWEAYTALGDISRNPNNPSSMDLGKAEDSYKQALRIKPDYPQALLGMLNVLIDTRRLDEAEKVYNKLSKEHTKFMKYTNVDRYEAEAHPAFGIFYSRKRYLQVLKRMADQYYAMRQYKKAVEKFLTILASDTRDIEVRLALGLSYQRYSISSRGII
jgi:tetratricopeptide (TPR) repeat protein